MARLVKQKHSRQVVVMQVEIVFSCIFVRSRCQNVASRDLRLSSAIMSSRSSRCRCPSIFVMQAAEDWFGGHTRKCGKSGRLF